MEHVFWLVPERLAGRAGPNRQPWNLRELRTLGIDAVLTLNDGEGLDFGEFAPAQLDHRCVPLPPSEPPRDGDDDVCESALPAAYEFVQAQHARGRAVLVHCSAGKDRTGLFMSYWLIREHGLDVDTAIARVRAVRPRALSALGWEALARRVLEKLRRVPDAR